MVPELACLANIKYSCQMAAHVAKIIEQKRTQLESAAQVCHPRLMPSSEIHLAEF